MSYSTPTYRKSERGYMSEDQRKYNRLYVAAAGNEGGNNLHYPAAYDVVLGVTGLWRNIDRSADEWYSYIFQLGDINSNFRNDNYVTYPISGIFGFTDDDRESIYALNALSTAPPVGPYVPPPPNWNGFCKRYEHLMGTSCATPQVSALAALMFAMRPEKQHWQVRDIIVNTRGTDIPGGPNENPLAGVVRYDEAINAWMQLP